MAVVNVAQCYADVEASKKPYITVKEMKANSSMLVFCYLQDFSLLFKERLIKLITCSFHDLPPELQCRLLEQVCTHATCCGTTEVLKSIRK
uniref:Saposin B-type domain-containing protein n=1 Tax=Heterorhabditis bacteriophora TaxID=37862 RepID=A0A1I7WHZ0_HETBA